MRERKITVVGLGYIGLPTAVVLAQAGHFVKGYDAEEKVRRQLRSGRIHIVEPHLQEAFSKVLESGHLTVTEEAAPSDVYVICVPTPFLKEDGRKRADLSYVEGAAETVGRILKKGDLVILESTVPPHTTRYMTRLLEKESGLLKEEFYTAHCPERVLPGRILYELTHNDRIIGSQDPKAAGMTRKLYETFVRDGSCYTCGDVTAELCKLAENTYRDINIAYANELAGICEREGIDVFQLIGLANRHPRVSILHPGLGVGGHCLAVDPWFIVSAFPEASGLIRRAREENERRPFEILEAVKRETGQGEKPRVGILGMAYKPDTDDLRESPSLVLAKALQKEGYETAGCEPNVAAREVEGIPLLPLFELLDTCGYLVVAIAHRQFLDERVKERIRQKPHYDCAGLLRRSKGEEEDFIIRGSGS